MSYSLRSLLHNPDFKLRLQSLDKRIREDYLKFWQAHAPHYTDHGETHCEAVEINLNELIPNSVKEHMNEYEIFLLLSSVLIHDIGMMCAAKAGERTEDVRSKHHERSQEFISKNLTDLLNSHERLIIGEISYAHVDSVPIERIDHTKIIRHRKLGDTKIRVRFLASLLRFGDACDICHTRTSEEFVGLSKLPEESDFHHSLHERVSGIIFDQQNKTIGLSINIGSNKEEAICSRFIVDKLKKCFKTVRDTLFRNNIFYVDIVPTYSQQKFLVPLSVPSSMKRVQGLVPFEIGISKLESRVRAAYLKKDYQNTVKLSNEILKKKPNDVVYLYLLAESLSQVGDLKKASENFEKVIEANPKNSLLWGSCGHFFGEINLDFKKSFTCMKKAYEIDPKDVVIILNYAEALNTIGEYDEAYQLSTKCWKETNEVNRKCNAQIIRIVSLFLKAQKEEGLREIQRLLNFLKGLPEIPQINWVYNKIRKYLLDTLADTSDKKLLSALFDLVKKKIALDDFEKIFSEEHNK